MWSIRFLHQNQSVSNGHAPAWRRMLDWQSLRPNASTSWGHPGTLCGFWWTVVMVTLSLGFHFVRALFLPSGRGGSRGSERGETGLSSARAGSVRWRRERGIRSGVQWERRVRIRAAWSPGGQSAGSCRREAAGPVRCAGLERAPFCKIYTKKGSRGGGGGWAALPGETQPQSPHRTAAPRTLCVSDPRLLRYLRHSAPSVADRLRSCEARRVNM